MIPKAHIVAWRQVAPWVSDAQVEQDLIMSRVLVAIFENATLASSLAFRGGTVRSRWFEGSCRITTFSFEELLGTKVRALYQRRKGRDLFDLWLGLTEGKAKASEVVQIFKEYMKAQGYKVKRKDYEKNIQEKIKHRGFISDLAPLLPADINYDIQKALEILKQEVISRI